uniref:Peptidase_M13 domain-containing protein n=1 Tax=Strongyloides papillosus TaxID=174720 RepID=A0A0N5BM26_STREA
MIKRIEQEFRLLIDEKKDIFDEETRKHFLHKLNTMKFVKNHDIYGLSDVHLMKYCYENIGINYNNHIADILKTIKHYRALSYDCEDDLGSCTVKIFRPQIFINKYVNGNAGYGHIENFFLLNSDILNEPSFSVYYPMSLNYGGIGYTIGHEMLHAFDSDNYKIIFEGDNKNKFNVTQMSIKNFEEKSACFAKQYGLQKESITNKSINGLNTLGENIADNGGIKIAHRAYMKWLQSNGGKDKGVPGFEKFTNEQLFFISAGRSYCEYKSKVYLEKQIDKGRHSPAEIRTNVVLSNYKPFADAFECKLNSIMNPEDKCELWRKQKEN